MSETRQGAGGNGGNANDKGTDNRSRRPIKRSVRIAGHSTSVSLEDEFWQALRGIAREQGKSLSALLTEIDRARKGRSLASSCRIYVLQHFQQRAGKGRG